MQLEIFDAQGRHVRKLVEAMFDSGTQRVIWDGQDSAGSRVASGVYWYRLTTPDGEFVRRTALVR